MGKIRIFLIEDNRLLREGTIAMINGQADMKVVAASSGDSNSLLKVRGVKPHVILVDLGLRNQNGVNFVQSVIRDFPEIKVIGMGLIPTQSDVVEFVKAGASGFILKSASVGECLSTIRAVAHGGKVLPPMLTDSFFFHIAEQALQTRTGSLKSAIRLTKREREVVALIADALSNKEIAQRLNLATYTVKSHVHNILEKLALHGRIQIAAYSRNEEPS